MDYPTFQITLAIKLSLQVYQEPSYLLWAHKWLDGSDRTADSAYAVYASDAVYGYAAFAASDAAAAYASSSSAADSIRQSISLGAKIEAVLKFI